MYNSEVTGNSPECYKTKAGAHQLKPSVENEDKLV